MTSSEEEGWWRRTRSGVCEGLDGLPIGVAVPELTVLLLPLLLVMLHSSASSAGQQSQLFPDTDAAGPAMVSWRAADDTCSFRPQFRL